MLETPEQPQNFFDNFWAYCKSRSSEILATAVSCLISPLDCTLQYR